MPLVYAESAIRDMAQALHFKIMTNCTDTRAYMNRLEHTIERHYKIRNPGVSGRLQGACEWILFPMPYIAFIRWDGDDAVVLRVFPTARIKRSRCVKEAA